MREELTLSATAIEAIAAEEAALSNSHTVSGFSREYRSMSYQQLLDYWKVNTPWKANSILDRLLIETGKQVYANLMKFQRNRLGLTAHHTEIEGFKVHWLKNNKPLKGKPTLLLIHGLSGDKDNWLLFAKPFITKYNLVIVDLPAHGDSSYLPDAEYSGAANARRLFKLLDFLNLDRVHLAGHSMGGLVATIMSIAQPERVSSLLLVSAAGMYPRVHSDLDNHMGCGNNDFITHSYEDYQSFMNMATFKPIWIPKALLLMMAKKNSDMRFKIVKNLSSILPEIFGKKTITNHIHELKMPVLCMWGKHDRIVNVDVMYHIGALLPHAKIVELSKAGHLPLVECPNLAAKHYLTFLAQITSS